MRTHQILRILALTTFFIAVSSVADAASAGMPWENPLQTILNSITGPVAKIIGALAITVTGLSIGFGEGGAGVKKMLWLVLGLSIAFTATSFFLTFLGFTGGATF